MASILHPPTSPPAFLPGSIDLLARIAELTRRLREVSP